MNDHVTSQGYSYYDISAQTRVGGAEYETLSHVYCATLDSLFDRQSRVSVMNIKLSCQVLLGILLSCHMYAGGKCHTIYIKPSEDASCGFSEVTGDPCYTWTGTSPTIVAPSTTLVFTSGFYVIQSPIVVSSMTNFTITGDPGARIACYYRISYGTAFTLSNIENVRISNLQFNDCVGNQLSRVQSFLLINCTLSHGSHQGTTSITMEYTNASVVNTFFYGRVGHIRMNSLSTLEVNASNFTSGYNDPRLYYPRGSVTRAYYNDGGSISSYLHLNVITIRDSKFLFNRAFAQIRHYPNHYSRGGAIYSLGEVTVINCLFNKNNASQGGAIYSERTVTVINSNFTGNIGPGDYNHFGGAIFSLSDIIAVNTTFYNNWARNGGATYSSSIVSTGSIFTNNTVNESSDNFPNTGNGGAIYALHDVTASSSSFIGNTAVSGSGGAVYIDANSTQVLFFGSSFSNNSALSCGVLSANRLYYLNVTMVDSTFSFNNAIGTSDGGGVACFGAAVVETVNCVFDDNRATSNAGVFNGKNSSIVIDESTFLRNMAQGNGGVMYTNEYQTNYTIQHSIFQRNSANDGGVMYVQSNSNIEIGASCTYIENYATDKGGVFYIRGGTLVIDTNSNSTFSGNTATHGGVISTCLSDVNVTDFGLEMQPDPEYPQYCSVYDEANAANGSISTTETTTRQSTTPYETSTHPERTTPNSQSSTHPEITTHFEKTSKPHTPSTTLAATTTTNAQVSTHTKVTTESAVSTAPTTPTTIAIQTDMTTPPTTVNSFHEDTTTSSTTEDSRTSGDNMGISKSTTEEVATNNPTHSTTASTDNEAPGLERSQMSVIYVSLGISLVSMIVTITVCIIVLLLFCKLWKKVNANSLSSRTYSLGGRRMSCDEDEYSFAVGDSSSIPSQHEEEKHLIPA